MLRRETEIEGGVVSYLHREGEEPIILLHGLGGSGNNWTKLSPLLDRRFELFMLDLAGHGRTRIHDYDYTIAHQVQMINRFIDAIGMKDPVLVGNSYGGWVALRVALNRGSTGKLVLIDSAGINRTAGESGTGPAEQFIDRVMSMNSRNERTAIERIVQQNGTGTEKISHEEFGALRTMTLLFWGSDDHLIIPEHASMMHHMIRNSQLDIIQGAGHTPHATHPAVVAELINAFLTET